MKEEDEKPDEEGEEEAENEDEGEPEVAQVARVPVPAAKGAKKKQQQGATADEDECEQSVEDPSMVGKPSGKRQRRAPAKRAEYTGYMYFVKATSFCRVSRVYSDVFRLYSACIPLGYRYTCILNVFRFI